MIQRMPGDGQTPPFDCVSHKNHRAITDSVRLFQSFQDELQIVPTQIGQQGLHFSARQSLQQFEQAFVGASPIPCKSFPDFLPIVEPQQALILVIAHPVDPTAQHLPARAGKYLLQTSTVF